MFAIYKNELKFFFNNLEGYVAIVLFLIINSLAIWHIPSDFNIFQNNQASLLPFFELTPWIFLILIPAITMKILSKEVINKTIVILMTKPIKNWEIIISKYLASTTIGIMTTVPTLIYVYTLYQLSEPKGNIDIGQIMTSYIGVFFIISTYSAIGIFCSSITQNIMISFISTIILIIILCFGLELTGHIYNIYIIEYLSMHNHYKSISRGILDSRDVIYFLSMTCFFLFISRIKTE
jgi:ABC-2 type transport system permease protein